MNLAETNACVGVDVIVAHLLKGLGVGKLEQNYILNMYKYHFISSHIRFFFLLPISWQWKL